MAAISKENKKNINLFLIGIKGYESLKFLVRNKLYKNINFVIVGRDKNISNDLSEQAIDTLHRVTTRSNTLVQRYYRLKKSC